MVAAARATSAAATGFFPARLSVEDLEVSNLDRRIIGRSKYSYLRHRTGSHSSSHKRRSRPQPAAPPNPPEDAPGRITLEGEDLRKEIDALGLDDGPPSPYPIYSPDSHEARLISAAAAAAVTAVYSAENGQLRGGVAAAAGARVLATAAGARTECPRGHGVAYLKDLESDVTRKDAELARLQEREEVLHADLAALREEAHSASFRSETVAQSLRETREMLEEAEARAARERTAKAEERAEAMERAAAYRQAEAGWLEKRMEQDREAEAAKQALARERDSLRAELERSRVEADASRLDASVVELREEIGTVKGAQEAVTQRLVDAAAMIGQLREQLAERAEGEASLRETAEDTAASVKGLLRQLDEQRSIMEATRAAIEDARFPTPRAHPADQGQLAVHIAPKSPLFMQPPSQTVSEIMSTSMGDGSADITADEAVPAPGRETAEPGGPSRGAGEGAGTGADAGAGAGAGTETETGADAGGGIGGGGGGGGAWDARGGTIPPSIFTTATPVSMAEAILRVDDAISEAKTESPARPLSIRDQAAAAAGAAYDNSKPHAAPAHHPVGTLEGALALAGASPLAARVDAATGGGYAAQQLAVQRAERERHAAAEMQRHRDELKREADELRAEQERLLEERRRYEEEQRRWREAQAAKERRAAEEASARAEEERRWARQEELRVRRERAEEEARRRQAEELARERARRDTYEMEMRKREQEAERIRQERLQAQAMQQQSWTTLGDEEDSDFTDDEDGDGRKYVPRAVSQRASTPTAGGIHGAAGSSFTTLGSSMTSSMTGGDHDSSEDRSRGGAAAPPARSAWGAHNRLREEEERARERERWERQQQAAARQREDDERQRAQHEAARIAALAQSKAAAKKGGGKKGVPVPCAVCKKAAPMQCSQCKNVRYCSVKCQERDWPSHERVCRPAK